MDRDPSQQVKRVRVTGGRRARAAGRRAPLAKRTPEGVLLASGALRGSSATQEGVLLASGALRHPHPRGGVGQELLRRMPRACAGRSGALLLGLCALVLWAPACRAAWFEVVGAKSAAAAELVVEEGGGGDDATVPLCDGKAANLTINVEGGTPPWKVALMRDGELYTRIVIDQSWSWSPKGTGKLSLPLPGRYSLSRVCDMGGCNGTVSDRVVEVTLARPPTARILPQTPVCVDDSASRLGNTNQSGWKIEVQGKPPIIAQFVRVGHQHEKRWGDGDGNSVRYDSPGLHYLPEEFFKKKGLWALSMIKDESECPADMASITWASTLTVLPRPKVSIELLSMETCGGQDALILVRLVQGNPPWSFTLQAPDGSLQSVAGVSDRTYVHRTRERGNHSVVNASDAACQALPDGLPTNAVEISTRTPVGGILHQQHIATCPGVFKQIHGEVQGIGPWWLEIRRNNAFWRRIRHPRQADSDQEDASRDGDAKVPRDFSDADRHFSFEVEAPGDYTLHSVTDSTQCSAPGAGRVSVSEKPTPAVRLQQAHACDGDALTLDVNASGACVVTVMASGWAHARDVEVQGSDAGKGDLSRRYRKNVPLFAPGEVTAGQYTITRVRDAECSSATSQTVMVHPKPEIVMRGSGTDVCAVKDAASLEIRARGGFMGDWNALIRHPGGHEQTVKGTGSEAQVVKVSEPGTYVLLDAFSLKPRCLAVLQPYDDSATPSANSSHADAEVKGRTVAVRRLEAPRAHLSGGGSICKQGGTGEDIAIQVQVTGGKGPYRILVHRDSQQGWMSVLGHDGRYSFDAKKKGVYWIGEVQDAHKCAWKEPSNRVEITHFPVALAAFKQQFIGLCPGDGPQEASVGVTARGSKAPWELAVLRNGRFHARGQPNSSGYFVFNTEEVVDGQAGDKYEIDKDTFTDSRGCLGEVRGSLTVQMNALPSVQVLSSDRQGRAVARAGTCEDEEMRLEFTAGTAPWSVTIELSSADDTPAGASIAQASLACEISGITQKIFSLSNLKDVRAGGATSGGGGGGGAGLLRTTCPGPASGRGFLPAGYHVCCSSLASSSLSLASSSLSLACALRGVFRRVCVR